MAIMVEFCSMISIGALQKTVRKMFKRDFPGSSEEEDYKNTEEELKKFTINDQVFNYTAIKNKLGGYRWFFFCPKCNNRVSKLFLPPKDTSLESRYLCKSCHKLKNQSVVMGQSKIYKKVTKPLKRMKEIEKKLERGYLSNPKIQILLDEYDKLEKNLKNTPEYRLYTFRKKHEISA
jgi:hypothetical protein